MTQELHNHLKGAVANRADTRPIDVARKPSVIISEQPDVVFRAMGGRLLDNTDCVVLTIPGAGMTRNNLAIAELQPGDASVGSDVRIGFGRIPREHYAAMGSVLQALMEKLEIDGLVPGGLGRGGTHITIEGQPDQAELLYSAAAGLAVEGWLDYEIGNTSDAVAAPRKLSDGQRFIASHLI